MRHLGRRENLVLRDEWMMLSWNLVLYPTLVLANTLPVVTNEDVTVIY